MRLRFHRFDDVEAFLASARDFLAAREAEHNLLFGITSSIRAAPEVFADDPPQFGIVADDAGRTVAATLRTPPNNQVLSMADDLEAVDVIVDALDEELPGVLGPKEVAARFGERWMARHGTTGRVKTAERIFQLDRVVQPERPAAGRWRLVDQGDREIVARWIVAFVEEAHEEPANIADPEAVAQRWIDQVGRIGYVWEDEGEVVSFVGASGETPNGIRIGPVYTPPERRGRGYASSLTAAASQDQLDRGRRFCFLFTDLANPTSNKIYQAVGYRPVVDVDEWRFEGASQDEVRAAELAGTKRAVSGR